MPVLYTTDYHSADAQAVWPILDDASEIAEVTTVSFVRNR